jgi:hypothetical protein
VYVVIEDEYTYVAIRGQQEQRPGYSDAAVLTDGRLLLSSEEQGLVIDNPDGSTSQLLEPTTLAGGTWLDPTETLVAFSWPLDWTVGGSYVTRRGIGVYSLETGEATLVLSDPERDIRIFGWVGDRIVFWWNYGNAPPLCLVDMNGSVSQLLECPPGLAKFHRMKGSLLPYETKDGSLCILDLATLSTQTITAVQDARWSKDGLQVLRDKGWETVDVGP